MRHVLYWLCVLAIALPMGARLFVPQMLDHSIDSQIIVGSTDCGIPTSVFDSWCEAWPRRPAVSTIRNATVLGALDALALLAFLVPVLRPGSRPRLAAPASFEGLAIALGCVLGAQFLLDVLSASSPSLAVANFTVSGMLSMLTQGFTSAATLRKGCGILWFWVVFAPLAFAWVGSLLGRRVRRPEASGGAAARRAAGACVVFCALSALLLAASLLDPIQVYQGLSLHDQRLAAVALIVASGVTAAGLLRQDAWARIAVVVLGVAALACGPVAAFFGVYLLWQRFAAREDVRVVRASRATND